MGVKIAANYLGNNKVEVEHEPSGYKIKTDAPADHFGEGKFFSPTDLVLVALTTCVMTTISIVANNEGIDVAGMRAEGEKHMTSVVPRSISPLEVKVYLPASLSPEQRVLLEKKGGGCPVKRALTAETQVRLEFFYE